MTGRRLSLRGRGAIIALDNDPLPLEENPPSRRQLQIKRFLGTCGRLFSKLTKNLKLKEQLFILRLKEIKSFFVEKKEYLPHFGLLAFALIAGASNIAARQSDHFSEISLVDPATSSVVVKQMVDPFTPQIRDTEILNTDASLALADGFINNPQLSATIITDRSAKSPANTSSGARATNIKYTIADGDTLSSIGWKYGVKLATLKYVNDFSNVDSIKPGQTLKIPPEDYVVSASQIAKKDKKLALASRSTVTRDQSGGRSSSISVDKRPGYVNNGYPYGWCTYYVATQRQVPTNMGNGGQWLRGAKANGMPTGSQPAAGAIVVTSEGGGRGHVAYVTGVGDGVIYVSEMNYQGWGRISSRSISVDSGYIKGYIY